MKDAAIVGLLLLVALLAALGADHGGAQAMIEDVSVSRSAAITDPDGSALDQMKVAPCVTIEPDTPPEPKDDDA
jgi:hypothetical protein